MRARATPGRAEWRTSRMDTAARRSSLAVNGNRRRSSSDFRSSGCTPAFVERLPVMRDVAVGVIERPFQPLELKRRRSHPVTPVSIGSKLSRARREIDALELQTRHAHPSRRACSLTSDFSLRGVPVLFEICDQCRAEMAVGLLTAINRHVAAERIERFFADPE